MAACCLAAALFYLVSCDGGLDVRQEYPFTVETMPVADGIANGETVEIRLEIRPDGKGSLKMEDGTVLKPNDRYLLNERRFRLYYTSQSADDSQTIDLYFEDNWGNMRQLTYGFNVNDAENNVPGNE